MTATSSQRPNLRPTWRSTPTSSKPHASVQGARRDATRLDAGDHAVEPRVTGDVDEPGEEQPPDPLPGVVTVHVHGVLDGGAVGGPLLVRRQRRETDDLAVVPIDHRRTATIALNAPDLAASHSRWSASERGTRSNVAVLVVTSRL